MGKDAVYTNGVIAAKENSLLGGKILKLCELSAEDAFRSVTESGFGKGSEAVSVYEYEKLLSKDESDLDGFIREYASSTAERAYFLAPRDFHNAKALFKARLLGVSAENMLAPEGEYTVERLSEFLDGDFGDADEILINAFKEVEKLTENDGDGLSGAEIGSVFDKALYAYLFKRCSKNSTLKKILQAKADMTDILTAFRSETADFARKAYVGGGKLKESQLDGIFRENGEKDLKPLEDTPYIDFAKVCVEAVNGGLPLSRAELLRDNAETEYLSARKYELKSSQPFLYYVFRRRVDNANLRILFVCLLAGSGEGEIKRRLRGV